MPSVDQLTPPDYALLREMTHASLGEFVIEYFFRRGSWVTRVHHLMSLVTLAAIVWVAIEQGRSFALCMRDFGLALLTLFVVILPLHELLHAAAYRLAGARDIRWDWSARMMAVWVIAHRFVVETRAFLVVALAPFVVLNAALIVAAIAFPRFAVYLLCVLLWHLHGSIGDWSLLNFVWLHRERGFWTFDDAEAGKSYFYGRAAGVASPHPMKTIALFSILLLSACAATSDLETTTRQCGPGEDLEIRAGLAPLEESPNGQLEFLIEVANNSDHDVTVESIIVNPTRVPARREGQLGIERASKAYNQLIEHGDDHVFRLAASSFRGGPGSLSEQFEGLSGLEFSVAVKLMSGETYRCAFAAGQ